MAIYDFLNDHYIPIFYLGDDIEKYDEEKHRYKLSSKNFYHKKLKPGLFYLPTTVLQPYGLIIKEGMYPHIVIQYLIDEGFIGYENLTYVLCARRYAPGKDLVEFVKKVWEILEGTPYGKNIINVAVGLFNTKYESKRDEVMLASSAPFTIAYMNWMNDTNSTFGHYYKKSQDDKNIKVEITGCGNLDMDWIRTRSQSRKMSDTGVINQYVVGAGLIRTLQMLKKKWKDGYKLVGLKTDAIYLGIPKGVMFDEACKQEPIIRYMNHPDVPDVHPMHYDDVARQMSEWHYEDWFIYDEPETWICRKDL